MKYRIVTGDPAKMKTQCLIVGISNPKRFSAATTAIDKATGGALMKTLRRGDLNGPVGQTQLLYEVPGIKALRLMLLNLGVPKELTPKTLGAAIEAAGKALNQSHATDAVLLLPNEFAGKSGIYAGVREAVLACDRSTYRFDQCKPSAEAPKRPLERFAICLEDGRLKSPALTALAHAKAIAEGVRLAKDLANLPGNICTPSYLAEQARTLESRSRKLKVTILEEKEMKALGMGALLSVSRGSRQPAKLIVLHYRGGKASSKPIALVGKGLTFDAGGISIKPAENMDEMKYDMCGGASVLGAMSACIALALPLNVVGVVPSSENLPDGDANKPGDIVTSMSGQTIEVLNTDAEGRLILCDALTYVERFEPAAVIDVATLTGACVIALGHHASGVLANDEALAKEVLAAGEQVNDRAWQLPLWREYQEQLKSNFADMANIGGRSAGAITAACFLSRYTEKMKWAHLDIAGTAWKNGTDKGATGRPVPLLIQVLLNRARLAL
jgi:leucyl aminopeptidase